MLNFNTSGTMTASNSSEHIATIPEGYRPRTTIIHNYISQQGNPMMVEIFPDGKVLIYNLNHAVSGGWIIRQCITYITA